MKISADRADSFVARPDTKARVVLVYGPDEGLVRERAARLAQTVVEDLNDPFRVAELTGSALKADPAALADEAASMALTGGRRTVRVRDCGEESMRAVESFLSDPKGDALIVLQASDLGPKSSLRKLVEGSPIAAAIPCYLDEGAALVGVIRDGLAKQGVGVARDALDFLVANLGGDRMVTRSEIDKLATYMGGTGEATLEDAMACVGDVSAMSMDDLAFAVADGDQAEAQHLLDRLVGEGNSVIPLLRSVARHFQRLHLAGGAMAQGRSQDQALALLKPPVFFKLKSRFSAQLRRWPAERAGQALQILLNAEIDCKTTGNPEYEITARALLQISSAARSGTR